MKKKYELSDINGGYLEAIFDSEENLLKVTLFMVPKEGVNIEDVFSQCGFKIESEKIIEKPKIVSLTPKGES